MSKNNQLSKVDGFDKLEAKTSKNLQDKFMPFFEKMEAYKEKAMSLVVTDASQKDLMIEARKARLALKEIRVSANKTRAMLKEDSLLYGRAVQGVYNIILYQITPMEKHLQEQEDFILIQETKRKAELKESREKQLQGLEEFVAINHDLANMDKETFEKLLAGARIQQETKLAEEKARIEKAVADAAETERIRIENEQLRTEAIAKEKAHQAQLEKEKAAKEKELAKLRDIEAKEKAKNEAIQAELNAKLAAEKAAKEKVEKELIAKQELEHRLAKEQAERIAKEEAAKLAAEKKARNAPDRKKLEQFASLLDALDYPQLESKESIEIVEGIRKKIQNVASGLRIEAAGI